MAADYNALNIFKDTWIHKTVIFNVLSDIFIKLRCIKNQIDGFGEMYNRALIFMARVACNLERTSRGLNGVLLLLVMNPLSPLTYYGWTKPTCYTFIIGHFKCHCQAGPLDVPLNGITFLFFSFQQLQTKI